MDNGELYINTYNNIDTYLRNRLGLGRGDSFSYVVREAAGKRLISDKHASKLKRCGDLRNAIVHDDKFPDRYVAIPIDDEVRAIQQIETALTKPITSIINLQKPKVFASREPITTVLTFMRENDFSQVVVERDGRHSLLERSDISRWLESLATEEGMFFSEHTLEEIFQARDGAGLRTNCVPRTTTFWEAMDYFTRLDNRADALLVTDSGKDSQTPLHIVTIWDMVQSELFD